MTPTFEAAIETPPGGRATASHFVVRGWCFERTGIPIRTVRLNCGHRTFPGTYGHDRLNLFAALSGGHFDGKLGFEVPVTLMAAGTRCELEALLTDDSWYPVLSVMLRSANGSPERNWHAFWRNAWRGASDVWHDLSEEERDFAAATTRVRGWFNLTLDPQRPPHPGAFERFPVAAVTPADLPRLAVVTASLNQGAFLGDAMRSVLDQEGASIDYIVEDGGSTDGSADIVRRFEARLAHSHSGPDAGQADAIATGFARKPGGPNDIMMFLNADDVMLPGVARFITAYFAAHPDVDVLYGHRVLLDEDGLEVGRWFTPRPACLGLAFHDLVPQETLFWRRRIWDRVGGIDRTLQFALDWDLLLRFEAAGARFERIPWFLGGFRVHARQKTQTRWNDVGLPEIHALRRRTLGRVAKADELHSAMRRAQVDSALVYAAFQRGRRI